MKLKNRIVTIGIREIKKNIKRFISLAVLSFLGVTVFVGIRLASEAMNASLDKYYDDNNMYDVSIVSTLGLTESDVDALNKLDDRISAYGTHSKDFLFKSGNTNAIIKVLELNEKNKTVILNEGRLPKNENEIVVESAMLTKSSIKIGDVIELNTEDDEQTVTSNKLKIVGTVTSPLYLINGNSSSGRGSTTIGNGKVDFYSYAVNNFFNIDYYTEINVNVKNEFVTDSEEYKELISKIISKIKSIEGVRKKARYNEIVAEANKEIDEKEKEALKEFDKAKSELESANKLLTSGLEELNSSESQLYSLKIQLDRSYNEIRRNETKIRDAESQLTNAKSQLDLAVNEINSRLSDYNLNFNNFLIIKKVLEGTRLTKEEVISFIPKDLNIYDDVVEIINYIYDKGYSDKISKLISDINKEVIINIIPKEIDRYDEIVKYIKEVDLTDLKKKVINYLLDSENVERVKEYIPKETIGYDKIIDALDGYKGTADTILDLFNAVEKIQIGYSEYNKALEEISSGKSELEKGKKQYSEYLNYYNNSIYQLNNGKKEYEENLNKYKSSLEEYNVRKFDFDESIRKAREKISNLDSVEWYISDRSDDSDYSSYISSIESIENVSGLFPVVFFAVAIFISLISMSRMAFENRNEIGTLKSLGFHNYEIRFKYIIYSLLATLVGGVLGAFLGYFALPWIIFNTYGILYEIPVFVYSGGFIQIVIGLIISVICICGATIFTINGLIKEKTTDLLRPKAPLKGRKILLEKVKVIWNKFSFSNKVTIRNIFRYKKRVFMTILGIVGCTVLLLSGYAIRDSIVNLVSIHFENIFRYDDSVYVSDKLSKEELNKLFDNKNIEQKLYTFIQTVKFKSSELELFVPSDENEMSKIITLKDKNTNEEVRLQNNKIIITSKFAKVNKIKVNDEIEITDANNKSYRFEVSAIAQNYLGNFIFMNKNTYEENFGDYKTNMVYLKIDIEKENQITSELLKNKEVLGINSKTSTLESLDGIFGSLDTIVLILVTFSGALAFVVLYNLAYINISERQREIATLKVLGFYPNEIDSYILKEELLITIIGVIIGLIIGTWFGLVIVETVEIDMAEFIKQITLVSYLKTILFMILFTVIVNIRVHFALKKINMIESLKSVE